MADMSEIRELIDGRYDGPHSPESVTEAAASLAALVRYLNNATGPGHGEMTLEWAATAGSVIASLDATVNGLDQLLGQLVAATRCHATDPTLYDDRRDRPGKDTASRLITSLRDIRGLSGILGRQLAEAHALSSHLGQDTAPEAGTE